MTPGWASLLMLFLYDLGTVVANRRNDYAAGPESLSALTQESELEDEPTDESMDEPKEEPTEKQSEESTEELTEELIEQPTEELTAEPSEEPSEEPSDEPSEGPTEEAMAEPTEEPTEEATDEPTVEPTEEPTDEPTDTPADEPTEPTMTLTEKLETPMPTLTIQPPTPSREVPTPAPPAPIESGEDGETPPTPAPRPPEEIPCFVTAEDAKLRRRKLIAEGGPVVQLMIGDSIGDAFGFGIEMEDAYWIRENVNFNTTWPVKKEPRSWWDPAIMGGSYSDDTEMTVSLMRGLVRHGRNITIDEMLHVWREEWDLSGERPVERRIMKVFGGKRPGHGSIVSYWKKKITLEALRKKQEAKENPGNSPPMRALPLGFLTVSDRKVLCKRNADATHPHPQARAASILLAAAANYMVVARGDQRDVIRKAMKEMRGKDYQDLPTETLLKDVDALPDWHDYGARFVHMPAKIHNLLAGPQPFRLDHKNDITSTKCGVGSDAMRTAAIVLYIVKFYRTPLDALTAAIDVGGDVDSTAALTMGLVGGSKGLLLGEPEGIPWWMVEELEGVEYLVARAKEFEEWLMKEGLWPPENRSEPVSIWKRLAAQLHHEPA